MDFDIEQFIGIMLFVHCAVQVLRNAFDLTINIVLYRAGYVQADYRIYLVQGDARPLVHVALKREGLRECIGQTLCVLIYGIVGLGLYRGLS